MRFEEITTKIPQSFNLKFQNKKLPERNEFEEPGDEQPETFDILKLRNVVRSEFNQIEALFDLMGTPQKLQEDVFKGL